MTEFNSTHTGAEIDDATGVTKGAGTGFIVKTAAGTGAKRALVGTVDQITISNGNGVSADPVLSLATAVTDSLALADSAVQSNTTGITGADAITNIVSLTQAEYDGITPNASTLYIIKE